MATHVQLKPESRIAIHVMFADWIKTLTNVAPERNDNAQDQRKTPRTTMRRHDTNVFEVHMFEVDRPSTDAAPNYQAWTMWSPGKDQLPWSQNSKTQRVKKNWNSTQSTQRWRSSRRAPKQATFNPNNNMTPMKRIVKTTYAASESCCFLQTTQLASSNAERYTDRAPMLACRAIMINS